MERTRQKDKTENFSPAIPRGKFLRNMAITAGALLSHNLFANLPETKSHSNAYRRFDEAGLITETVYYEGVNGYMSGLLARPDVEEKLPGLMIIHENRGLNNHGKDIAKRAAMEGYCVIAPDALSPVGGTIKELNENKHALKNLDKAKNLENFQRGLRYLQGLDYTNDLLGVMGFSWGAGVVNQLVVKAHNLQAAVAYYGQQTPFDDVKNINTPLLLHYAEQDEEVNKGIATFLIELLNQNKEFKVLMHQGVDHYFNNPVYKNQYDKKTAKKAWKASFDFLNEKLDNA